MEKLNTKEKNYEIEKNRLELHFIYTFTIAIIFIAFLMSDRWTSKDNFTDYLANAATFISIVLGLVAIFYSFISNSSLSQSLGNISKVSDEVTQAKNQISKHAADFEKSSSQNAESLREISVSVERHVTSLKDALGSVADKTLLLQEAVGELPDKLKNRLDEASNETNSKPKIEDGIVGGANQQDFAEEIKTFLKASSLVGRLTAYACVLANESGNNLALTDVSREMSASMSYIHGFFVAMVAAGFVRKTDVEGENRVYKITYVDETIKKEAKTILTESLEKRFQEDTPNLERNLARVKRLERLLQKV